MVRCSRCKKNKPISDGFQFVDGPWICHSCSRKIVKKDEARLLKGAVKIGEINGITFGETIEKARKRYKNFEVADVKYRGEGKVWNVFGKKRKR